MANTWWQFSIQLIYISLVSFEAAAVLPVHVSTILVILVMMRKWILHWILDWRVCQCTVNLSIYILKSTFNSHFTDETHVKLITLTVVDFLLRCRAKDVRSRFKQQREHTNLWVCWAAQHAAMSMWKGWLNSPMEMLYITSLWPNILIMLQRTKKEMVWSAHVDNMERQRSDILLWLCLIWDVSLI